jgi:hypothetical protein
VLALFKIGKALMKKLQRPAYRQAYLSEHVRRGIAYQIRALRDQRGWNQGAFSKHLSKPQSVVCRLEDPSYGKVTIQTLLEIASVFDVALQVRFVPFSVFLQSTRDVSASSMEVAKFQDDVGLKPSTSIVRPIIVRANDDCKPMSRAGWIASQGKTVSVRVPPNEPGDIAYGHQRRAENQQVPALASDLREYQFYGPF